jgi:hypothetical protein
MYCKRMAVTLDAPMPDAAGGIRRARILAPTGAWLMRLSTDRQLLLCMRLTARPRAAREHGNQSALKSVQRKQWENAWDRLTSTDPGTS